MIIPAYSVTLHFNFILNSKLMRNFFLMILLNIFLYVTIYSQQSSILFKKITIHNGKGDVPYIADVLIKNDIISAIGSDIPSNISDTVIFAQNYHLYPAIISCNNILGLQEAEAVRPTSDYADIGEFNPHLRTLTSYNTDSKILPTVFSNGVMYTQCTPRGSYIAGSSSVVKTKAWNWEDAEVCEDGIHLYMPSEYVQRGWWAEPDKTDKNQDFSKQLSDIKNFLTESKTYYLAQDTNIFSAPFEAMKPVWSGQKKLYVHCSRAKDILNAIELLQIFQVPQGVLVECDEIYKVLDAVKKYQYPVILSRTNALPDNDDDDVKINFEIPALLEKNNILYTISMSGDMEAMQSRNLPFVAGMGVPYGLSKEKALKSITYNAAKILGIEKELGSIEVNKKASLIVSKGDILDPSTQQIVMLLLEGKIYSDKNFQYDMYQKYLKRYHLQN